ncbi:DUF2513 domain-containing protein [Nitrosomonas sp. ANs5]|uniref:DUF2513 domain-containing protein n=1 Tax=Nitrosomonas sp. ANs5 TaxID=3423941 RepID=UPI003D352C83
MKRDLDLMRDLLIQVEETTSEDREIGRNPWRIFDAPGRSNEVVRYHVRLLMERELFHPESIKLDGQDQAGRPVAKFLPDALNDHGHNFLASIRDDEVWTKTKAKLKRTSGNAALEVVVEVAKSVARGIILGG